MSDDIRLAVSEARNLLKVFQVLSMTTANAGDSFVEFRNFFEAYNRLVIQQEEKVLWGGFFSHSFKFCSFFFL
jgi:hypothetical protein